MAERSSRRQEKKGVPFFIGRWAWIFMLGELILLLSMFLFTYNDTLHPQAVACGAGMAIGVVTALLARRVLSKYPLFVRFLFSALSLLICIVGMNWLTAGQAGFGFKHDPLYGSPLLGLVPLGAGLLAILVTLLAWTRKKKRKSKRAVRPSTVSTGQERSSGTRASPTSPAGGSSSNLPSIITGRTSPIVRGSSGSVPASPSSRSIPRSKPAAGARSTKKKSKANRLRLVGAEEHRCPYCLELVRPNDPRGVVICDICHAYHHKDCWDVTGRCQVPHQSNSH